MHGAHAAFTHAVNAKLMSSHAMGRLGNASSMTNKLAWLITSAVSRFAVLSPANGSDDVAAMLLVH